MGRERVGERRERGIMYSRVRTVAGTLKWATKLFSSSSITTTNTSATPSQTLTALRARLAEESSSLSDFIALKSGDGLSVEVGTKKKKLHKRTLGDEATTFELKPPTQFQPPRPDFKRPFCLNCYFGVITAHVVSTATSESNSSMLD